MTECNGKSDEEIIVQVNKNHEVFGCLIERYEDKLRRYIRRLMPGLQEEADDVLQEIFIKVYVHVNGFDKRLKFSSWIYRIAHNEAVSWLRKKKSRPALTELGEDDFHTFTESLDIAQNVHEGKLAKDEVSRTLSLVQPKYRSVLVLKFLEGRSYEEMSDILSVPSGTVATLIHRAKKEFSSMYQKQYEQ